MVIAFFIGLSIGFITAMPVAGPISALVFSYGMKGRFKEGWWLGAGAGIVEGMYCLMTFFGVQKLVGEKPELMDLASVVAAILMTILGFYFFFSKKMRVAPHMQEVVDIKRGRAFFLGASVSAVNLTLLATWTAVITSLYSLELFDYEFPQFMFFPVGVTFGIILWFNFFLFLIKRYKDFFEKNVLDKILKTVGVFLVVVSIWIVLK